MSCPLHDILQGLGCSVQGLVNILLHKFDGQEFNLIYIIVTKVEEEDDIQNVPATVEGGRVGKEETSAHQEMKPDESTQQKSSIQANASDLPPHVVLEMPALSPTMV